VASSAPNLAATRPTGSIRRNGASVRGGAIRVFLGSRPTITNNIVVLNTAGGGGGIFTETIPTLSHNDFWGNTPDDYSGCEPGAGDISADPGLFDPYSGNVHLQLGSPCVDAGDSGAPGLPTTDFGGDRRTADGDGDGTAVVDIGADERVVTVPSPQPPYAHDPDWWTNVDLFEVGWTNPDWPRALRVLHYTLDVAPAANADGGVLPIAYDPGPSVALSLLSEGEHSAWIWLEDEGSQMDYRSAVRMPAGGGFLSLDLTAPANPIVDSSDPSPGVWSSDTTVRVHCSGAADALSGIGGYSFSFSQAPDTAPDTIVDTVADEVTSEPGVVCAGLGVVLDPVDAAWVGGCV